MFNLFFRVLSSFVVILRIIYFILNQASPYLTHFQSMGYSLPYFTLLNDRLCPKNIIFVIIIIQLLFLFFLNPNLILKVAFLCLIQNMLYFAHILRPHPFYYNHGVYVMNCPYEKNLKSHGIDIPNRNHLGLPIKNFKITIMFPQGR